MATSAAGTSVLIIGGGGHARVVADAAEAAGMRIAGFLDDNREAQLAAQSPRYTWQGGLPGSDRGVMPDGGWIVGLGDVVKQRRRVLSVLSESGAEALPVNVVHPRAFVSESAVMGLGVFVGPCAVVHACAAVEHHAIINTGAIVEHDCHIGENTHIGPGAVLGGNVSVGSDCLVGLGSRVLPGVRIGRGSVIGAGAVITRDVLEYKVVMGVPGREA